MQIYYQYWKQYPSVGEPDENASADEGERFFIPHCDSAVYQIMDERGNELAEGQFPETGYSYVLEERQLIQFGHRGGTRVVCTF